METRLVRTPGALLAIAVLLAACSPNPPPATLVSPQPSPSPLPSDTPLATDPPPTSAPPTPSLPPPSATAPEAYIVITDPNAILGTWRTSLPDFVRFYADGAYNEANDLEDLETAPFAIGSYEFSDGYLLVRETEVNGVPSCGGKVGRYELRLLDSGRLQIVVVKDACGARAGDTIGLYERVP
jgi:hypothetical protein